MCVALRDKSMLPAEERQARRVGRCAAIGGAALGVGVAVHAVGTLGVAGYNAAGLTSGLATLGGVVGGGMAQGVLATLVIPVLFAGVVGYLRYRLTRWFLPPEPLGLRSPTGLSERRQPFPRPATAILPAAYRVASLIQLPGRRLGGSRAGHASAREAPGASPP